MTKPTWIMTNSRRRTVRARPASLAAKLPVALAVALAVVLGAAAGVAAIPMAGAAAPLVAGAAASPVAGLGQESDQAGGTVVGLVFDSTRSEPLAGARVAVMGTPATGESDEEGRFRLDEVPAGEHMVWFFHPRLGTLGVNGSSQSVVVTDQRVSEVYLATPSRPTILAAWCSGQEGTGDTSIGGVVTDALTGVPLPSAVVAVLGEETGILRRRTVVAEARTETAGEYRLCNLELGDGITVQATFGRNQALPMVVSRRGAQLLDVAIPISEPVTITGTVHDWVTSAPIQGAQVSLLGSPFTTLTDSAGVFGFTGVPPGRQVVRTDFLGYATRTDSLTVFSNEALGLEIALSTEAIVLEPLVVTGRRRGAEITTTTGIRFAGFTEAQMDSVGPRVTDFAALARRVQMPGLLVSETFLPDVFGRPQMGVCVQLARARSAGGANTCNMVEVRINDTPVPNPAFFLYELNPLDIRRLQFITPMDATVLYGERASNGVLLLYTR